MNILFICHRLPFPPNRGGKIRPFHIISHLNANHRVTVASLARSEDEAEAGTGIRDHCHRFVVAGVDNRVQTLRMMARAVTPDPFSMGYFYSRRLARRIRQLLEDVSFDLIMVHCSSMAPYVGNVKGIPKILDFGDMDSMKWLDIKNRRPFPLNIPYWMEGQKLMRCEKRFARQFDICTTTTRAEMETLASYETGCEMDWFPNGVNTDFFTPGDGSYEPHTICFLGRMDYYPNQDCMIDFCGNTLPLIRQRVPDVKLLIVGAEPSAAIRQLGHLPGVTVTGWVPDVRPYARKSALMVAPLNIARGTQNKMLESMSMGVPVVCSRTALKGVSAMEEVHLLAADTPSEYADAIVRIFSNPGLRHSLSVAGRERAMTHHDWQRSMQHLDGIIDRCLQTYGGRRTYESQKAVV